MAYALPVVATVDEGGLTFRVRALPWGLAREASRPGADSADLAARIYERCVDVAAGEKPPVDDLPASLVGRFAELAAGAQADGPRADPPSPPSSTAPGSGG